MNPRKRRRVAQEADEKGFECLENGDYQTALEHFFQAAELWKSLKNERTTLLAYASSLGNAANVLHVLGKYEQAKQHLEKILPVLKKELGSEHPDVASSFNNLANIYVTQYDYIKAKELHEKSLAIREKVFGESHPDVAISYNNLAIIYSEQGDYNKSKKLYEKSLTINEKVFSKSHLSVASNFNNLAGIYLNQGDYAKAKEFNEKALAIREKILGKSHLDVANSFNNLAIIYSAQGNYNKTKELYEKALSIEEKILGELHPSVAIRLSNLAKTYSYQGNHIKAEELLNRAKTMIHKIFDEEHPDVKFIENSYLELQAEKETLKQKNIEQQIKLKEAEKLSYLGCMATGIAHNINNPTGIISLKAQRGLRRIKKGELDLTEAQDIFEGILHEVKRLASITQKFQDFAKGDRTQKENVNLNQLVERIRDYFSEQFEKHDINLILELADTQPQAYANQFVIEEVLINLVTNARDELEHQENRKDATVWVKTAEHQLQVEDNGQGVPEAEQQNLFLPFHSNKAQGTGLGLHFAKSALERIDGKIRYQNRIEGGACFIVDLLPPQGENHE